ncbi:MAG: hypothetical protein L0I29_13595 [Hyphomicrobiales bacterium]|nr:hypothetical protein [Hyphomicrobiales bacterium]
MKESGKPVQKDADRTARLAEELRANLQRRKVQARSRRAGEADRRPEGIAAAPKSDAALHKKDEIG